MFAFAISDQFRELADGLLSSGIQTICLIAVAVLIRWVLHRLIDRLVKSADTGILPEKMADRMSERGVVPSPRRAQRAQALGGLFKSVVTGVIVAVFGTMILGAFGINVAPIIASAGIIGLALGFGAQKLVQDYLAGVFMIIEDQYGVGDVVDLGEAIGTVEAVTLRVTRLRALDGTVWYVPNGQILRVGNQSQNWARAVVDVGVAYHEDLVRVKQVLAEVAHDLWSDDEYKHIVIEEPEVTGVEALAADAITLRVLVKTQPLEQWKVARELRQRIKARFDYEGFEIPFAQRVIWHREENSDTTRAATAPTEDAG